MSAAAIAVAMVAFVSGWLAGRSSQTTANRDSARKIAKQMGWLTWSHRITAVLVLAGVVVLIRAFMVDEGIPDDGPRQPVPSEAAVPTPR